MNDPARQGRIDAAHRDPGVPSALNREVIAAALEAADAIEPRPVYLTTEELALVKMWVAGARSWHGPAREKVLAKLRAVQERKP